MFATLDVHSRSGNTNYFAGNFQLRSQLGILRNCTLICHCADNQPCHGDAIIALDKKGFRD